MKRRFLSFQSINEAAKRRATEELVASRFDALHLSPNSSQFSSSISPVNNDHESHLVNTKPPDVAIEDDEIVIQDDNYSSDEEEPVDNSGGGPILHFTDMLRPLSRSSRTSRARRSQSQNLIDAIIRDEMTKPCMAVVPYRQPFTLTQPHAPPKRKSPTNNDASFTYQRTKLPHLDSNDCSSPYNQYHYHHTPNSDGDCPMEIRHDRGLRPQNLLDRSSVYSSRPNPQSTSQLPPDILCDVPLIDEPTRNTLDQHMSELHNSQAAPGTIEHCVSSVTTSATLVTTGPPDLLLNHRTGRSQYNQQQQQQQQQQQEGQQNQQQQPQWLSSQPWWSSSTTSKCNTTPDNFVMNDDLD